MVGKTRIAAQVVTSQFADWPVAIPDSPDALAKLDAAGLGLEDCVI